MDYSLELHPSVDHQTLTVSTSVVTFDDCTLDPVAKKTLRVIFQVDPASGNIRMTKDGATDPVAGQTGFRYDAGDVILLNRMEAEAARFVRDAGTDAELQIQAEGEKQ